MSNPLSRRSFLGKGLASAALVATSSKLHADTAKEPKLKKAVKFPMIRIKGSIEDKFNLIKSLGFRASRSTAPATSTATRPSRPATRPASRFMA